MFSRIHSAALNGLNALHVLVEVNANMANDSSGMADSIFLMVGLPDNAVRESRQRVMSAFANSKLHIPRLAITANFALGNRHPEMRGHREA